MAIVLEDVIKRAAALGRRLNYLPQDSEDVSFFRAVVDSVNVELASIGGGAVGQYNFTDTATGDYAAVDDAFFTPAVNGLYRFAVFAENLDGGAAGGDLDWEIVQGVTSLGLNSPGIFGGTLIQLGTSFESQYVVAGVPVIFRRAISSYSGGNSAYRISASALLLA